MPVRNHNDQGTARAKMGKDELDVVGALTDSGLRVLCFSRAFNCCECIDELLVELL